MQHLDFIISCIQTTASHAKHKVEEFSLLLTIPDVITCECMLDITSLWKVGSETQYTESGDMILPLFTVPKALESLLPVFLYGLMNGSAQLRETSANGITDLLIFCEASMLKPVLIKTTGPLIRVAGDRFPSSVKV